MKYKVRDIANKMALLDREVKYLINKAKIWRPKQESATNHTESTNENATNTKEGPESEPVLKSTADSETENFQSEDMSENRKVQNEKSLDSEESTDSSKDNESKMIHENTQEGIHQEL